MASTYNEKTLTCSECGAEFVHSVADQQRYAERGFTSDPKRCPTCRQARRAQQQRGGPRPSGGNLRSGGGEGDRGQRASYPVVCSSCGKETTVPFQPRGNRPVYCRECYQAQRDSS
jgi:CxxC-x17-CxxC domain-containing protein